MNTKVTPEVLCPRPETELLVKKVQEAFASDRNEGPKKYLGLELGLGSGVISIELLSVLPGLKMIATEISQGAIDLAQKNAHKILNDQSKRLETRRALPGQVLEPFEGLSKKADFFVSNPPYLSQHEDEIEQDVLQYEPEDALFEPHRNYYYKEIADGLAPYLKVGAPVFLELSHLRSQEIAELFLEKNWSVELFQDLNQRDRILVARMKESGVG